MVQGSMRQNKDTGKWYVYITGKTECVAGTIVEVLYRNGSAKELVVQGTVIPIKGGYLYRCKSFENTEAKPIYEERVFECKKVPKITKKAGDFVTVEELDTALGL